MQTGDGPFRRVLLGIILYQCPRRTTPFVGEYVVDVLAMHMMQEPRPLTDYNHLASKSRWWHLYIECWKKSR